MLKVTPLLRMAVAAFEPSGANEALDKHAGMNNLLAAFFRDSLGMEEVFKGLFYSTGLGLCQKRLDD